MHLLQAFLLAGVLYAETLLRVKRYSVTMCMRLLRLAKTENICVKMPGIFTLLHKYHPIGVFCEDSMYSLHVERNIYITAA